MLEQCLEHNGVWELHAFVGCGMLMTNWWVGITGLCWLWNVDNELVGGNIMLLLVLEC